MEKIQVQHWTLKLLEYYKMLRLKAIWSMVKEIFDIDIDTNTYILHWYEHVYITSLSSSRQKYDRPQKRKRQLHFQTWQCSCSMNVTWKDTTTSVRDSIQY